MQANRSIAKILRRSSEVHVREAAEFVKNFLSIPEAAQSVTSNEGGFTDTQNIYSALNRRCGKRGPSRQLHSSSMTLQSDNGYEPQENQRTKGSYGQQGISNMVVHKPLRIKGLGSYSSRRDVLRLLDGFDISGYFTRLEYDQSYRPLAWWVSTAQDDRREKIIRNCHMIRVGGHTAKFTRHFPLAMRQNIFRPLAIGSRERYVLVTDIQENATMEDLLRLFKNFDLSFTPVTIVREEPLEEQQDGVSQVKPFPNAKPSSHYAVVRFQTKEEAHRAVRTKNNSFLLNTRIRMRVLQ
eukprot:jgi/Botrbrau1/9128/Bobra.160_3s0005.1